MIEMPPFTPEYLALMKKYWQQFQNGEDVSKQVRPVIYESWLRSRATNVCISDGYGKDIPNEEMEIITQEEELLTDIATPILERIFTLSSGLGSSFVLANKFGIALKAWYGHNLTKLTGRHLREQYMGTSGVATCLQIKDSIVIYGSEHYCEPLHNVVCVGVPIFLNDKKIIGAIGISSTVSPFHPYCIPLLEEAAKSISEQARLRTLLATENFLIESIAEGILVVDQQGKILRSNRRANQLLNIEKLDPDVTIGSLFKSFQKMRNIAEGKPFRDEEVVFQSCAKQENKVEGYCVLSYTPSAEGGILTLRSVSEMHAYAAKTITSPPRYHFQDIIGKSQPLQECIQLAEKVALSDFSVLLLGESGTGKELFAQSIHNASNRKKKPFIAVNCGALPHDLVQSELFGYVEGAFTGASRRGSPGKFELADGGTIFLDEIGEMPLDAQVSLLRLLQSGEVIRLGGHVAQHINVRVIAATNRNLYDLIKLGKFREDLFYRLNVFVIKIPPLRERLDDIHDLVLYFLKKINAQYPQFKSHLFVYEAMQELQKQPWPGNIRELEHVVERAVFTASNHVIQPGTVQKVLTQDAAEKAGGQYNIQTGEGDAGIYGAKGHWTRLQHEEAQTLVASDRISICEALRHTNGNVAKAATLLGVSRTTLYTKLIQYGVSAKSFKRLRVH